MYLASLPQAQTYLLEMRVRGREAHPESAVLNPLPHVGTYQPPRAVLSYGLTERHPEDLFFPNLTCLRISRGRKGDKLHRIMLILLTNAVTGLTRTCRKRCQGTGSCCFRNVRGARFGQFWVLGNGCPVTSEHLELAGCSGIGLGWRKRLPV